MKKLLNPQLLEAAAAAHVRTGGRAGENEHLGFRPAFYDMATCSLHLSTFADGRPAPVHLLDGLLLAKPDSASLREGKAITLARLGERKAAATEYALSRELRKNPAAGTIPWARSFPYHVAMGDREGAIVRLDRLVRRDYGRWPGAYNVLRNEPELRSLHGDPRVKAMLERGARWTAEMKASGNPPPAGTRPAVR